MISHYWNAAYYIELEEGESLDDRAVQLGGQTMQVGDTVRSLGGRRKRSTFSMKEGWSLRFVGWFGDYILFDTVPDVPQPIDDSRRIYYAFAYLQNGGLFVHTGGGQSGYDIEFPI